MNKKKVYRIGIDMRMAGEGFGIGRYSKDLASALLRKAGNIDYTLFFDRGFNPEVYEEFSALHKNCKLVSSKYYSAQEQFLLPYFLNRQKFDLVHFLNFNVPILYRKKFIVTIHDLIHHRFPGRKKRNILHRIAYRFIISQAVKSADCVIAVSNSTKSDIIKLLNAKEKKIVVVPEGISNNFIRGVGTNEIRATREKFGITKPYFLFVGEWRQYKNVEFLAQVFSEWIEKTSLDYQLVLAGGIDKHYSDIKKQVYKTTQSRKILAPGKVEQKDLVALYSGATAFINPSLSEGFGLTYLEAQACKTPVLASDIPTAREVLGESAIYFDPLNKDSLKKLFSEISNNTNLRQRVVEKGIINADKFTWEQSAVETQKLYLRVIEKSSK